MECQKCKMTAGRIEEFSSLCIQGACQGAKKGEAKRRNHSAGENNTQRQEGEKLKQLQSDIKKAAKKDKKTHILEQFRENKEDKHKKHLWKAIKAMKSKFTPRYIQMRNRKGTLVPLKKRAEAIADYLENSHWSNPTADGGKRNICREPIRQN